MIQLPSPHFIQWAKAMANPLTRLVAYICLCGDILRMLFLVESCHNEPLKVC